MSNISWLKSDIIHRGTFRRLVPSPVKRGLRRRIRYADYRSEQLRREAMQRLCGPIPTRSDYDSPYPLVMGVFSDQSYTYTYNIAACRDLRVRFRVLDITASDWLQNVRNSECDAFMATPTTLLSDWRQMCEERLWVVSEDLKKMLCPTFRELFLWESKRRMRDWLVAHNIPHPQTWVYSDREQAREFCRNADYPMVCKTNRGAASSGIFVLRGRRAAERMVDLAFSKGLMGRSADARDREWGSILFQEYIPHDFEWRIVRTGDSFMCRKKVRLGDFASGSGEIGWSAPLPGMLDFARKVTDTGAFRCMTVDLFQSNRKQDEYPYLVNELQAIIGFRDVPNNEHTGRWKFLPDSAGWIFEPGCFHQNACANLRVQLILTKEGLIDREERDEITTMLG